MVTIKENRTGRIIKVGRQFANVFIRLGTHTKVDPTATKPIRKVVAEIVVEKQAVENTEFAPVEPPKWPEIKVMSESGRTEAPKPRRKYTRRKKQTDTDS